MKHNRKKYAYHKPLGGFTLVELLVVISIIALLMAILMPSLQIAREKAKQIVCISNLHNFGLAMFTYSVDENGKWPSMIDPTRTTAPEYWTSSFISYAWANPKWMGLGLLYKYVGDNKPYFCPNERDYRVPGYKALNWNDEAVVVTTGVNQILGSYCIRGRRTLSEDLTNSMLSSASKKPLVACWFLGASWYPGDYYNQKVQGLHRSSADRYRYPVLFGDGHCVNAQEYSFADDPIRPTQIGGIPALQNWVWADFEKEF